jgi:hypothetical protein
LAYFRNYGTAIQKLALKPKIIEDEIGVTRSTHYANSFKIFVVKPEGKRPSVREDERILLNDIYSVNTHNNKCITCE